MDGINLIDLGWWIGFIGGILLAVSYFPQLKKMWERRNEEFKELAPSWFIIALLGTVFMWLYGFIIEQPSIVILNTVCLFSYGFMLYMFIKAKVVK